MPIRLGAPRASRARHSRYYGSGEAEERVVRELHRAVLVQDAGDDRDRSEDHRLLGKACGCGTLGQPAVPQGEASELEFAGQELRAAFAEGPILVAAGSQRHDHVGRFDPALGLQPLAKEPIKCFLHLSRAWAGDHLQQ